MTSHILLNRLPRLLCFTVTLLFAARLCQAACIPTDTTKLPNQRPNQDALTLLLKAQATCPLNTPDFLSRQSRNQRGDRIVRRCQSCREPDDGVADGAL